MKKTAFLLSALLGLPLLAHANVSVSINSPGVSIHIGDRDNRGYYWDGYDWRNPTWWGSHHNRRVGMKGPHGYWNGNGWQSHNPGHHAEPKKAQHQPQHESKPQHKPEQNYDNHAQGKGQPVPPHK